MFVHYERELKLFQEWPHFGVIKYIVQRLPFNVVLVYPLRPYVRTYKSLLWNLPKPRVGFCYSFWVSK